MTNRLDPLLPEHRGSLPVNGSLVVWEHWRNGAGPTVVLVHGTAAHSGWWHHTIPWLRDRFEVVAVDLSGHGDSGHRDSYSLEGWASEVATVVQELCTEPVILVGHSIGGLVVSGVAASEPGLVAGVVLVDCIVEEPGNTTHVPSARRIVRFATLDEGVERHRLLPRQPVADLRVLNYVAERALRPLADGGFTWKVDPHIFDALECGRLTRQLDGLRGPAAVVRGELSQLVGPDAGAVLSRTIGRPVPQYDVPDAYHHVMIDQGPSFGRTLRRALEGLVDVAVRA